MRIALVVVALARVAHADATADATKAFRAFVAELGDGKASVDGLDVFLLPYGYAQEPKAESLSEATRITAKAKVSNLTVVPSKSGTSAWVAADLAAHMPNSEGGGMHPATLRASAFLAHDATGWHVRAAHWSLALRDEGRGENCVGITYPLALDASVPGELAAPVKAVVDAIAARRADAFTALFSDDKRALAIGSAPGERYVGPAIKKAFARWSLGPNSFEGKHGVRAGTVPEGDLAWVVLGVMAPAGMCTEYRAFLVLQREGSEWKIVHQHYSDKTLAGYL